MLNIRQKKFWLNTAIIFSFCLSACSTPERNFVIKTPEPIQTETPDSPEPVFPTFKVDPDLRSHLLNKDNIFLNYGENPFVNPIFEKFSTFAMDVDTASFTWMRKALKNSLLPDEDSVRIEEYINYFDYDYTQPSREKFSINTDLTRSPFGNKDTYLMRIGLQGKMIPKPDRKPAHLTFVIDVSGSMAADNRLELVKESLEVLVEQLNFNDKVAIVVYGTEARSVLELTSDKEAILNAIKTLAIEGSTNVEAGLKLGYQLANKNFSSGTINRVILCSDGVANIGSTTSEDILFTIKGESDKGIALTTVGFGMGNFNDVLMEQLANQGDGQYAYVDTLSEARRIFDEELTGTLQTIAKDAKVQVEFNPQVSKYRLLGYENRQLKAREFRDEQVDAGEVGAGHSVTALYELKLKSTASNGKLAEVYIRYKEGEGFNSVKELSKTINIEEIQEKLTPSFQLAIAVAKYAEIMRKSAYVDSDLNQILSLVQDISSTKNEDKKVLELIDLIQTAIKISN